MNLTEKFAQFIVETHFEDLPEATAAVAGERLLDTIGAMIAGRAGWIYGDQLLQAVEPLGSGNMCPIGPGRKKVFPLARVAMLNATFAHAVELDDGHKYAGVHAGAVVVPTALALGEGLNASGREILTAIVLGYEVVYRLAVAQSPELIDHGFHPSAVCDTAGAMAVAGKLLKLDEKQLASGLGMAGLQASGLMEATVSGQQSKCVMVGNAAFAGISCAYIAQAGLEGCLSTFEGKSGLFRAMSKELTEEQVTTGLGESYLISDTYSKFYPTCRHSQPAIEAVLDLAREHAIDPQEVACVAVGTHRVAYDLTGRIQAPQNSGEARFSIAYGVAAALIDRGVTVLHLKESAYTDPKYLLLARRVHVTIDSTVDALYPKKRGAKVKITLRSGESFEKECYDLKGSPQNPVGLSELIGKFEAGAKGILAADVIHTLIERCGKFETERNISSFMDLLNW